MRCIGNFKPLSLLPISPLLPSFQTLTYPNNFQFKHVAYNGEQPNVDFICSFSIIFFHEKLIKLIYLLLFVLIISC